MITTLNLKQNSPEWLQARVGKITGSIADKLLLWGKEETVKLNEALDKRHNFYTARGHLLEDEALEIYAAIHKQTVERPGLVVNDNYADAACSPDGICDKWLLEVKCYAAKKHLGITNRKTIPFQVMSQLQFNLLITGLKRAKLILYNPDIQDPKLAYREIIVWRDLKVHQNLIGKLKGKK